MKIYSLMLCLALLGTQLVIAFPERSQAVPDCSHCDDGETLPDASSCSRYYLCAGGKALPKVCARGLCYDAISGLCNIAFMVDCTLNRLGHRVKDIDNFLPNMGFGFDQSYGGRPAVIRSPSLDDSKNPPCTTTTCAPETTTTCPTTTKKTPPPTTTTPCTTTTCTTTTRSPKNPPCTRTREHVPKTTPPCITTRKPPPPPTTTTTCTTKTTPCPTTTTRCPTTTTPCITTTRKNENTAAILYYTSSRDCVSLPDNQVLLDKYHCRRYYICNNKRTKRYRCPPSFWFDRDTLTCRVRALVTNCLANTN